MEVSDNPQHRISLVEREVHALTAATSALAQGQSELRAIQEAQGKRLEQIGVGVDKLIDERGNRGFSLPQLGAGVIGLMAIAVAFMQVLDLQLAPERAKNDRQESALGVLTEFRTQTHHEFGKLFEHQDEVDYKLRHFDERRHIMEDRVAELERKAAAAEVSRKAIGDYVRQIDELGSRRWMQDSTARASRVE